SSFTMPCPFSVSPSGILSHAASRLCPAEGNQGDLRRAVEPDGGLDPPDPAIRVKPELPDLIESHRVTAPQPREQERPDARQADLPAMAVARELELHRAPCDLVRPIRLVHQRPFECRRRTPPAARAAVVPA